jgi:hypothetical protein
MIVVHSTVVSTLYPRIVILSLRERLENLIYVILYTSFVVWLRDHYMSLQRFTMGRMLSFTKVVHGTISLIRFPGVVAIPRPVLHHVPRVSNYANSNSFEQGTLPTTSLITKQVIPYRTHGDTYYPGVSTTKIQSLVDSSMTIHTTRRNPTISTISTHAQTTASILTMVTSRLDGWKTNTLNTNTC